MQARNTKTSSILNISQRNQQSLGTLSALCAFLAAQFASVFSCSQGQKEHQCRCGTGGTALQDEMGLLSNPASDSAIANVNPVQPVTIHSYFIVSFGISTDRQGSPEQLNLST